MDKEQLSDCCGAPMTEVYDGIGRCSDCKDGCAVEGYDFSEVNSINNK